METVKIDVVFRKFKEGDILALFPFEDWNVDGSLIASYQHIGQHGGANPELIFKLGHATYTEYEPLLQELISIGYEPNVIKNSNKLYKKFPEYDIPLPI